jgi:uncharacterized membrane protein YqiK
MKEVLIVILSAVVGYIVLSAFSVSDTPGEAVRRILERPADDMEQKQKLDLIKAEKEHEERLAELQKEKDIEALRIQQETEITKDKHDTEVEIKEIDSRTDSTLATIKYNSSDKQKEEDNKMLIAISLLAFILIYIYLKYQKSLAQDELEKEKEYKDMLAKKEYAERILAIVATGNISVETEHKLLKILDELNNPHVHLNNPNNQLIQHPNPDIEQLPLRKN